MIKHIWVFIVFFTTFSLAQNTIAGKIVEKTENQKTIAVEGVSVYWLNTKIGTSTNEEGRFVIPYKKEYKNLVISYIGYKTDTLLVTDAKQIIHHYITAEQSNLGQVTIESKRKAVQQSYFKTENIFTVNSDELLKAACCNLSESFETNPSIDVHFADALVGAKQIKMLGLTSPYLLITQENIPYVRGASQALGLTFTPGTWVESIQITKGAGSVIYGFESIGGQINAELVKPSKDKKVFLNTFYDLGGRAEVNAHFNKKISSKWHSGLYVHSNYRNKKNDNNKDGFLDMPLSKQINLMNRWQYTNPDKGWISFFNIRYLNDEKQIGQTHFNPKKDAFTQNAWGGKMDTKRFEASTKLGYVFPEIPYQSVGVQMAYSHHLQKSYFGLRTYDVNHKSWYANVLFSSIITNTMHKFTTGINMAYDNFNEKVEQKSYDNTEKSVGAFFEYAYDNMEDVSLTAGIRTDYHNVLGFLATPRLHMRYMPFEKTTFRMSVGYGKRIAHIFAENQQLLGTNRTIKIDGNNLKSYGLNPEEAWNYGIAYLQGFNLWNREGSIAVDFYRTHFLNQVVVDWEKFGEISFYNLQGKSIANNLQVELNYTILKGLHLKSAYKFYDIKTKYKAGYLEKVMQPKHRFFANVSYETKKKKYTPRWKFDYTLQWTGRQRLPNTLNILPKYAKKFMVMNTQITKVFSDTFEVYIGGENIANHKQKNPILGSENPFGNNFDSSIVYSPVSGAMWYAGLRYSIK